MLNQDVSRYIALNPAMGLKFRVQAYLLRSFAAFAEQRAENWVCTRTVLQWAALGPSAGTRRGRLLTIRRFAEAMRAEDGRHEVPPPDAFGCRPHRNLPHVFTHEEIRSLVRAAGRLEPRRSLRPIVCSTLVALLATTGLRISEALNCNLLMSPQTDSSFVRQSFESAGFCRSMKLHNLACTDILPPSPNQSGRFRSFCYFPRHPIAISDRS
jgi:hypothetical protein